MHTDLTGEVEWVLNHATLANAVDGFVFGIRPDTFPCDGYAAIERCLSGTNYQPLLHVPCVGFDRTSAPTDEVSRQHELARVAEAVLLARAYHDTSVVIDNFVELDRGYFNCRGLVDRFCNPKDGSRIVTSLDSLLPRHLRNLTSQETRIGRVIYADSDDGKVLLNLPGIDSTGSAEGIDLPGEITESNGSLINLSSGEMLTTNYRESGKTVAGQWQSPSLLLLDRT